MTLTDVILGEAAYGTPAERYRDMKAIASTIANRARALGVTPDQVVSNPREFNAYGRSLPPGTPQYRSLAEQAWEDVQTNGPTHSGMFYATPSAVGNLPKGLKQETTTSGHVYYSDPQNRAIGTSLGYRSPLARLQPVETASQAIEGLLTPEAQPATVSERMGLLNAYTEPQEAPQMANNTLPTRSVKTVSYFRPEPEVSLDTLRQPSTGVLSLADQYASYGAGKAGPMQAGLLSQDVAYQGLINGLNTQKQQLQAGVNPMAGTTMWKAGDEVADVPEASVEPQGIMPVEQPQPVSYEQTASVPGLLSPQEEEAFNAQRSNLSRMPAKSGAGQKAGTLAKDLLGAVGGGLLGSMALGPLGGLLGAALGKSAMTGRLNTMVTGYPRAPSSAGSVGNTGAISRDQLTGGGRDIYDRSGQFRSAVDKGSVGLY